MIYHDASCPKCNKKYTISNDILKEGLKENKYKKFKEVADSICTIVRFCDECFIKDVSINL